MDVYNEWERIDGQKRYSIGLENREGRRWQAARKSRENEGKRKMMNKGSQRWNV